MKTVIWILVLALLVLGYVFVGKNKNFESANNTPRVVELEKQSAKEPTAEALIDAQFGIPEDEAEARYEAEMKAINQ